MADTLSRPSSVESLGETSTLSSWFAGVVLQDSPKGSDTSAKASEMMLTRLFSSENPTSYLTEFQPLPAQSLKPKPSKKHKKPKPPHKKIAKSLAKFIQKAPVSAPAKTGARVRVPVETEDESAKDPDSKWTCKALKKKITNLERPSLLHTVFFTINFVMFGLGMAGFAVGLIALNDKAKLTGVESSMDFGGFFEKVASILIPIGLVFITLGLLGAAGVATQNPRLLLYYAMLMGGLLAIEVLSALCVIMYRSKIEKDMSQELIDAMKTDYDGKHNSTKFFSVALDWTQYYFGCCGIEGKGDFKGTPWYNRVNNINYDTITTSPTQNYKTTTTPNKNTTTKAGPQRIHEFPVSCCKSRYFSILTGLTNLDSVKLDDPNCYFKDASDKNLHTLDPCVQALKDFLVSQVLALLSLTFTFVGMEVSAASNAYAMSKEIELKLEEERQEKEGEEAEAEVEAEEDDTRI